MGSRETWLLGLGETLHCLEAELVDDPATWALPALRLPDLNSWCSFHWWLRQRQEERSFLATTLLPPWEQSTRPGGSTRPQGRSRVVSVLHCPEYD